MPDPAVVANARSRRCDRGYGRPATLPRDGHGSAVRDVHAVDDGASTGVHVWSGWLDEPGWSDGPAAWLDDDERARAARYRFVRDRQRFVARRRLLRRVLAGYLGVAPATIRYARAGAGRPELDPPCDVNFSVSHSEGLAIIAVARDRLVGVDVERVRPIPDALNLARSLFARREYDHLRSTADDRSAEFLRLWTRKEAYAKGLGVGMSLPFDFDVLDDEAGGPRAIGGSADGAALVLASLDGPPGYVGCVAVSGADLGVQRIPVAAIAP